MPVGRPPPDRRGTRRRGRTEGDTHDAARGPDRPGHLPRGRGPPRGRERRLPHQRAGRGPRVRAAPRGAARSQHRFRDDVPRAGGGGIPRRAARPRGSRRRVLGPARGGPAARRRTTGPGPGHHAADGLGHRAHRRRRRGHRRRPGRRRGPRGERRPHHRRLTVAEVSRRAASGPRRASRTGRDGWSLPHPPGCAASRVGWHGLVRLSTFVPRFSTQPHRCRGPLLGADVRSTTRGTRDVRYRDRGAVDCPGGPPSEVPPSGALSVTTSDLPAEGQPDVSTEGTEAPFDDVITLSTSTGDDGVVTVTVVGEVDTFTAPVLRSTLDSQLEQQPKELVIDLSGVQFLGSAGLAVLVETQKSSRAREVALSLIATTRAVTRPLEVTVLIDLFTIADNSAR